MKSLYESLLTGKVSKPSTYAQPQSREELQQIIDEYIKEIKPHPGQEVDFNWIDISGVDDLSELFENTNYIPVIDKWKIDHVEDFYHMFAYNKHITSSPIPALQKKLLVVECYMAMFYGCTSLVEPPELPATKLTEYCYAGMFYGCTSLKVAPQLPAMKLENGCYTEMFSECTSLKVAPELPAKELAKDCYRKMFKNCSRLEVQAKVPAEADMNNTYYTHNMYRGCLKINEEEK